MIDKDLLRQIGWSDQLIDAVQQEAEPLRRGVKIEELTSAPVRQVQALSATAIFSDAVANNTLRDFTVTLVDEPKESH